MMKNVFFIVVGLFFLLGCQSGYDEKQLNPPNYIEIVSDSEYLVVGGTVQYSAIGHYDNNVTIDLSDKVYWSHDHDDILSVDEYGLTYGRKKGFDTLYVSWNNMVNAKRNIEVKAFNRLVFNYPYVEKDIKDINQTHQNDLSIVYDDLDFDRYVNLDMFTWTSSDSEVASVDAEGLITMHSLGDAKITATVGTVSRSMKVVVQNLYVDYIEIVARTTTVLKGLHERYRAFAHYCDGSKKEVTNDVMWSSSDNNVASIEAGGYITTYSEGNVTISASYGTFKANENLHVNTIALKSLYINSLVTQISKGYSETFYVMGSFEDGRTQEMEFDLVWSSSNSDILIVDELGTAYGNEVGYANVEVAIGNIKTFRPIQVVDVALESIKIIPEYIHLPVHYTLQYQAQAHFRDGRVSYFNYDGVWDILQDDIASIDYTGLVTAHTEGKAVVEFIYDKKITKDVITVTP
ncbi:MAG: Ig-like domain-containing protein [Campylobacterota bacterium]|nr:Ig-like domain-containing protein [Campylobacterota bacterium]